MADTKTPTVQSLVSAKPHTQAEHENELEDENEDSEDFWEAVHEVFANLTVFLIFFHVSGVVLSSRKHKQNLVRAMITGYKE